MLLWLYFNEIARVFFIKKIPWNLGYSFGYFKPVERCDMGDTDI